MANREIDGVDGAQNSLVLKWLGPLLASLTYGQSDGTGNGTPTDGRKLFEVLNQAAARGSAG